MLKKLMRYDFKSVFKLWWIGALSTFVLSFIGGGFSTIFYTEKEIPVPVTIVAVFAMIMVYIAYMAFGVFSDILVYVRFYKNFYTDQGYLTFTLPAKRQSILNSKVFLGFVTTTSTSLVLFINLLIVTVIGAHKYIFSKESLEELKIIFEEFAAYEYNYFFIIFLVEALVLFGLLILTGMLFNYGCISVASVLVKKAKILAAVGIYYVATSVLGFIFTIFYLFGLTSLVSVFSSISELAVLGSIALLLLIVIFILCAACSVFYYVNYWCLHKKLNLA